MYWGVKAVRPTNNYNLILTFENGEVRQFDMNPYLELGVFKELKDIKLFESVHLSFDTIEWDNEADLDPELLYKNSIKIEK